MSGRRARDVYKRQGALLAVYWESYLVNLGKTLLLALVATVIGCLIGLVCGILNTIPYTKKDNWFKRFFLKLVRVIVRVYVEVFHGTPMELQAVFKMCIRDRHGDRRRGRVHRTGDPGLRVRQALSRSGEKRRHVQ